MALGSRFKAHGCGLGRDGPRALAPSPPPVDPHTTILGGDPGELEPLAETLTKQITETNNDDNKTGLLLSSLGNQSWYSFRKLQSREYGFSGFDLFSKGAPEQNGNVANKFASLGNSEIICRNLETGTHHPRMRSE